MVWLSLLARSPVELGWAVSIISLYSVASSSTAQLSLTIGVCTVLSHGTICSFPMLFPFLAFVFLQYFCNFILFYIEYVNILFRCWPFTIFALHWICFFFLSVIYKLYVYKLNLDEGEQLCSLDSLLISNNLFFSDT